MGGSGDRIEPPPAGLRPAPTTPPASRGRARAPRPGRGAARSRPRPARARSSPPSPRAPGARPRAGDFLLPPRQLGGFALELDCRAALAMHDREQFLLAGGELLGQGGRRFLAALEVGQPLLALAQAVSRALLVEQNAASVCASKERSRCASSASLAAVRSACSVLRCSSAAASVVSASPRAASARSSSSSSAWRATSSRVRSISADSPAATTSSRSSSPSPAWRGASSGRDLAALAGDALGLRLQLAGALAEHVLGGGEAGFALLAARHAPPWRSPRAPARPRAGARPRASASAPRRAARSPSSILLAASTSRSSTARRCCSTAAAPTLGGRLDLGGRPTAR